MEISSLKLFGNVGIFVTRCGAHLLSHPCSPGSGPPGKRAAAGPRVPGRPPVSVVSAEGAVWSAVCTGAPVDRCSRGLAFEQQQSLRNERLQIPRRGFCSLLILQGSPLSSGPWAMRRLEYCEGKLELSPKPELGDTLCPEDISGYGARIRVLGGGLVHGCCWSQDRKTGQLQKKKKDLPDWSKDVLEALGRGDSRRGRLACWGRQKGGRVVQGSNQPFPLVH